MSKKLKTDITSGQKPPFERRIYIHLPKEDEHNDHIIGEVCCSKINRTYKETLKTVFLHNAVNPTLHCTVQSCIERFKCTVTGFMIFVSQETSLTDSVFLLTV